MKHHEVVRRSRISNDFPAGRFLVCHSAIHIFSKPQQQSIIRQTLSNHNKADNVKSKKKVGIKRNLLLLILAVLLVLVVVVRTLSRSAHKASSNSARLAKSASRHLQDRRERSKAPGRVPFLVNREQHSFHPHSTIYLLY